MSGGLIIGQHVPWNAGWSGEEAYEIRSCRWAGGKRALWSPHRPGEGRPIFAKPHMVRQRRSVAQFLCTVCGERTPEDDRWWFRLGDIRGEYFMTTEAPVHRRCADHALAVCPNLREGGADRLEPFPAGWQIAAAIVGGPASERDFGHSDSPIPEHVRLTMVRWSGPKRTQEVSIMDLHDLGTQLCALNQEAFRIFDDYGTWKFGEHRAKNGDSQITQRQPTAWLPIAQNIQTRLRHLWRRVKSR